MLEKVNQIILFLQIRKKKKLHFVNEELIKAIYVILLAWNIPPPPSYSLSN